MPTCKTCGAEILWIVTPTGKAHPVDAKPEKRWVTVFSLDEDGGEEWALVDTYLTHFATCPQADQHRRSHAAE